MPPSARSRSHPSAPPPSPSAHAATSRHRWLSKWLTPYSLLLSCFCLGKPKGNCCRNPSHLRKLAETLLEKRLPRALENRENRRLPPRRGPGRGAQRLRRHVAGAAELLDETLRRLDGAAALSGHGVGRRHEEQPAPSAGGCFSNRLPCFPLYLSTARQLGRMLHVFSVPLMGGSPVVWWCSRVAPIYPRQVQIPKPSLGSSVLNLAESRLTFRVARCPRQETILVHSQVRLSGILLFTEAGGSSGCRSCIPVSHMGLPVSLQKPPKKLGGIFRLKTK